MNVLDLIRNSTAPIEPERFDELRAEAIRTAELIWNDRAQSYNLDSTPTDEMPYGIISGVSEVYKRVKRLKSLTSPLRETPYRAEDIARMMDTAIDMMNYGSWLHVLLVVATAKQARSNLIPSTEEMACAVLEGDMNG